MRHYRRGIFLSADGTRAVSTNRFDQPPFTNRQKHTFKSAPVHSSNYFGGRTAQFREIGPIDGKKAGRKFKIEREITQYNVDIWCAQQTLRKQWKGRDWDVVEMPFELAPPTLQRVIPELHTDIPLPSDPKAGDYENVRSKVFDVEELQDKLFPGGQRVLPDIRPPPEDSKMTLDKFL